MRKLDLARQDTQIGLLACRSDPLFDPSLMGHAVRIDEGDVVSSRLPQSSVARGIRAWDGL